MAYRHEGAHGYCTKGSDLADNPSAQPRRTHTQRQKLVVTGLYLVITALLCADQNLLSPNLSAIAAEFNFNDMERDTKLGGDIAIAFFLVGLPASLLVGCLTDVVPARSSLFLGVVLVGEGACLATFWVQTYAQLYWCRALTGCSVGGVLPLVYSVLGDLYLPEERGWVSGIISVGVGVGIAFGQGLAGILGPRYGWRMPFLVLSAPAILCAIMVWWWVGEVQRGGTEMRGGSNSRDEGTSLEMTVVASEDSGHEIIDSSYSASNKCQTVVQEHSGNNTRCPSIWQVPRNINANSLGHYFPVDYEDPNASQSSNQHSIEKSDPHVTTIMNSTIKRIQENAVDRDGGLTSFLLSLYEYYVLPQLYTISVLLRSPSVILLIFQGAPGCIPWGIINTYLNDYLSSDRGMSVEGATLVFLIFGIGSFVGTILGGIGSSRVYSKFGPRYPSLLSGAATIISCFPMWAILNYGYNFNEGSCVSSLIIVGLLSFVGGASSGVTGPVVKATLQNVTLPRMRGQAFALLNVFDGRGLGPALVAWLIQKMNGRGAAFNVGVGGWVLCGILNGLLFFTVASDEEKVKLVERFEFTESKNSDLGNHVAVV